MLTGCGANDDNQGMNENGLKDVRYNNDANNNDARGPLANQPNVQDPENAENIDMDDNKNNPNKNKNNNYDNGDQYVYDTEATRRIASQVNRLSGVDDAHALINGNTVVIGIDTNDDNANTQDIEEKVRTTAKSLVRDKNIRVVSDESIVNRIGDVYDKVDNGNTDEVQSDIRGIMQDIGNAAKRPFENNNK